jgi:hypothetical protein
LVKDIQTIDLRSGSYTDNFHALVDGLISAGIIHKDDDRPFLREPAKISLGVVFRKALSWALAWSLGWFVFWTLTFVFLFIFIALEGKAGWEDILNFLTVSLGGAIGGFTGGLIAGFLSMLALRPYAPSIFWKHMSPTIRIWMISGPLGMIISGIVTVTILVVGIIGTKYANPACQGVPIIPCLNQIFRNAYAENASTIALIIFVFFLIVMVVWFLTGMLAGWMIVRHVRKLEPGITRRQGWSVSTSWGCGAILAAAITVLVIGLFASLFHL